jgi:aspartyl-tRNA synthetase
MKILENLYCLSALMGNTNLKSVTPYVIKKPRLFAKTLMSKLQLDECLILDKCNCIEIYYVAENSKRKEIIPLWKKNLINKSGFLSSSIYEYKAKKVIDHLFKTACGLKSITLGDNQVIGQIHKAIIAASEDNTAGIILKTIFNNARKVSNIVRNTTDIGKGNVSAERTSVDMIIDKSLTKDSLILIIGTGSTGTLLCNILNEKGYHNLIAANRTTSSARNLLKKGLVQKVFKLSLLLRFTARPKAIFFATSKVFSKKEIIFLNKLNDPLIFDLGTPQNTLLVKNLYKIYPLESINNFAQYNKKLREGSITKAINIINSNVGKTIDAITFHLKEEKRRQRFHINESTFKEKGRRAGLKSQVYFEIRKMLIDKDFIEVQTPTITAVPTDPVRNDPSEEIFFVDWYGRKMMLRQSNQLYKQMLVLSGINKLFEIGPFWRAEQNPTPRHLSEAYGLDIEIANIKTIEELISLVGEILEHTTKALYKSGDVKKDSLVSKTIMKINYIDAVELLNKNNNGANVIYGTDLGYDLENELAKIMYKLYKKDVFAIVNYPESVKKFYTKRGEGDTTLSFDIIYKGWEIVSGAVRETNYLRLKNGIKELGFRSQKYDFYLNAFKLPRPHGGFCLGIDRFLVKLLGLENLSEIILFPRSEYDIIP